MYFSSTKKKDLAKKTAHKNMVALPCVANFFYFRGGVLA